jgi:hypothetical protein
VPGALVGQVLDRFPERGERLLRLFAAIEGEQRRQAPHQGIRVVGCQGQQEIHGLQGLLVLLRGQSGVDEKADHVDPIRREFIHLEQLLDRVGGAASA